jgi:hypothetical protein
MYKNHIKGMLQEVCQINEGCNYFTYSSKDSMCYLYKYRWELIHGRGSALFLFYHLA